MRKKVCAITELLASTRDNIPATLPELDRIGGIVSSGADYLRKLSIFEQRDGV
jgi:hypothetical protein